MGTSSHLLTRDQRSQEALPFGGTLYKAPRSGGAGVPHSCPQALQWHLLHVSFLCYLRGRGFPRTLKTGLIHLATLQARTPMQSRLPGACRWSVVQPQLEPRSVSLSFLLQKQPSGQSSGPFKARPPGDSKLGRPQMPPGLRVLICKREPRACPW